MAQSRRRRWTPAKRKRAQAKAKRSLRRRLRLEAQARAQGTTQFGFLLPLGAQLRELHLRERVAASLSLRKSPGSIFQTEDVILGLSTCQLAGFRRIDHLPGLATEIALAEQIGMPRWFGETTARDFLELAEDPHIEEMRTLLRDLAYEQARPDRSGFLYVHVDWTKLPAWPSRKEGVRAGSDGGKKTELCQKVSRVLVDDLVSDFALHSGNRNPTEMVGKALEHGMALARLHPKEHIVVTADSGFDSVESLEAFLDAATERSNLHFAMAISAVPHSYAQKLAAEAEALRNCRWTEINRRTSICDLGTRKVFEDSTHYPRAVVVRRMVQKYRGPRGRRYKVTVPEYELIVTDFPREEASARQVFAHYHRRQEIEASIKDSKQSFALCALPSHHFRANHFFLGIVGLAQFLHALYRRRLWPDVRAWAKTLVRDFYSLPGHMISAAHFVLAQPYRCWRRALRARRLAFIHFRVRLEFSTP